MKVLIADDDRTSRVLLAAMVAKWGYEPLVVTDGGAAWTALQQPDSPRSCCSTGTCPSSTDWRCAAG